MGRQLGLCYHKKGILCAAMGALLPLTHYSAGLRYQEYVRVVWQYLHCTRTNVC